ncbi:MAG: glycosyltransferase family 4 protein [Solirubrobacteraceae bacterium]
MFFPRGGSAHVALNLARALPAAGWDVTIVSGSLSLPGRPGDARAVYGVLDVHPVDFTRALDAADPLRADPPLHPSFEDRTGAPDRVFAAVDDATYEHQVACWARALADAGAADADVLHLHHLTPINEAAALVAPSVPVVGHLHGTELLMLEEIERGGHDWPYAAEWAQRLRDWAGRCERLVVLSDMQVARAEELLGVDPERCVRVSNGYDPQLFDVSEVDRAAHWRRHLVEEPLGWKPGEEAGSVRYSESDLEAFGGTVLLYVGRFTAVKRLGVLIEAYARARPGFMHPAPLVLVGGFPGEWEGEHPADAIARTGARDVYLAGWHGHHELPDFLNAADLLVLPSVAEQFGQVLVEAMACGLPCVAVDSHGPAEILEHGDTGWLVEPDDVAGLANALVEAVNRPEERRRRGGRARAVAADRYSWPALAEEVAAVYGAALGERAGLLTEA